MWGQPCLPEGQRGDSLRGSEPSAPRGETQDWVPVPAQVLGVLWSVPARSLGPRLSGGTLTPAATLPAPPPPTTLQGFPGMWVRKALLTHPETS